MSDDNIIRLNTTFDLSPLYEANENAIKAKLRELGWVNLDPGERVINIERVKELVSSMEEGAVIRGGQHLMERWGELRKELGLE